MSVKDITRKTSIRNGVEQPTNAYLLARMLSDKRRVRPVTRKMVIDKYGFDPAPYASIYECFEIGDEPGTYVYKGKALQEIG